MINDGDPWDKKTITERIEAGEAAIARARGEGRDVSAWEAHLTELKQLARLGVTVDDVLRIFPGGKIVYKVFDADNNVLDTPSREQFCCTKRARTLPDTEENALDFLPSDIREWI